MDMDVDFVTTTLSLLSLSDDLFPNIVVYLTPKDYTQACLVSRYSHTLVTQVVPIQQLVRTVNNWVAVVWRVLECNSDQELDDLVDGWKEQSTTSGYPITRAHLLFQLHRLLTSGYFVQVMDRAPAPFLDNPLISHWLPGIDLHVVQQCGFWESSSGISHRVSADTSTSLRVAQLHRRTRPLEDVLPITELLKYFTARSNYEVPLDRARLVNRLKRTRAGGIYPIRTRAYTPGTVESMVIALPPFHAIEVPSHHQCFVWSEAIGHHQVPFSEEHAERAVPLLHSYRGCETCLNNLVALMNNAIVQVDPRFLVTMWSEGVDRGDLARLCGKRSTRSTSQTLSIADQTKGSTLLDAFRQGTTTLLAWSRWTFVAFATQAILPMDEIWLKLKDLSTYHPGLVELQQVYATFGLKWSWSHVKKWRSQRDTALVHLVEFPTWATCEEIAVTESWWFEPDAIFRAVRQAASLSTAGVQWSQQLRDKLNGPRSDVLEHSLLIKWRWMQLASKYYGARWPYNYVQRHQISTPNLDPKYHSQKVVAAVLSSRCMPEFRVTGINAPRMPFNRLLNQDELEDLAAFTVHTEFCVPLHAVHRMPASSPNTTLLKLLYGLEVKAINALSIHSIRALIMAGRWNEARDLQRANMAELGNGPIFAEFIVWCNTNRRI